MVVTHLVEQGVQGLSLDFATTISKMRFLLLQSHYMTEIMLKEVNSGNATNQKSCWFELTNQKVDRSQCIYLKISLVCASDPWQKLSCFYLHVHVMAFKRSTLKICESKLIWPCHYFC